MSTTFSSLEGSNTAICTYDVSTGTKTLIAVAPSGHFYVEGDMSSEYVVWTDHDLTSGDYNILGKNLATHDEFTICGAPDAQFTPAIDTNWVVWADSREGGSQSSIYAYNLSTHTERKLTNATSVDDDLPDIWDNIVVWHRVSLTPGIPSGIYGYDLLAGQEFPIALGASSLSNPAIYGQTVVWDDGEDIWGAHLTQSPPTTPELPAGLLLVLTTLPVAWAGLKRRHK